MDKEIFEQLKRIADALECMKPPTIGGPPIVRHVHEYPDRDPKYPPYGPFY